MIKIHDPNFPNDETRAVELSLAQLQVVREYVCECLNARQGRGQRIREGRIIQMLEQAGKPIAFNQLDKE
jgi:hypothetical protein